MGKTANREPATRSHEEPASSPVALIAFVRLLARHAAHEAFATAEPAVPSEHDHPEPEDTFEAEV
ncbi:hypothetical protein KBI52_05185 [Microvirga sp. HBU67558]|uniref:hypothetical protein n=1 Tax=Microvirga TaxID=186650 RepID=UPI001B36114F|nr:MULTISPECIES: hypothetical protein [unclassified Microvirga]MBQ0819613.1 hypothetical protein [Microvirga sp. HBU67558]